MRVVPWGVATASNSERSPLESPVGLPSASKADWFRVRKMFLQLPPPSCERHSP